MRKIKVLVVDDSAVFRKLMEEELEKDCVLEVVDAVGDAYEARDSILKYRPDVMALDIELPRMNGIHFLKQLLPQYPIPTVMVSSVNGRVFEALDAGAVDFVAKPAFGGREEIGSFLEELKTKIKIASTVKMGMHKKVNPSGKPASVAGNSRSLIAIGASTGGTEAIYEVVKQFDKNIPGVVIVQHMPAGFTKMYAERLNNQCRVVVKEAATGDQVQQGKVLIAPGELQMRLVRVNGAYTVECKGKERVNGHCPSVDVLFDSVAKTAGSDAIGVILTGMGGDGAKGLLKMRKAGAETIGQDKESSVVYGMPRVAYEIGAVKYQLPVEGIAAKVYSLLNTKNGSCS